MLIDNRFDIHLSDRHEGLKDYSKEHREILLFARKIRETLFDDIEPKRLIEKCKIFYRDFLSYHMEREEKLIFTVLPAYGKEFIQPRKDHIRIERRVINMMSQPDHIWQLRLFIWQLEGHVLYQEKRLFKSLEDKFSDDVLLAMKHPNGKLEFEFNWNEPFYLREG